MQEVYKANPNFINFVPKTAAEAVDRFTRCRRRGLTAYRIPECVIECAKGLNELELDRFEQWIINPTNADVINISPNDDIQKGNKKIRKEVYDRVYGEDMKAEEFPPIMNQVDLADIMDRESSARRRRDCEEKDDLPEVPEIPADPPSSAILPASAPSLPPRQETEPPPLASPTCAAL